MLKLTYNRKNARFKYVTVLGDPQGIWDVYWQLTHNYQPQDGTEIGEIRITNLDGVELNTKEFLSNPFSQMTHLSSFSS
jgi:hypothetical protein